MRTKESIGYLYFFACLLFAITGKGQSGAPTQTSAGRLIPASPEASTIALYQNYPVDYVTGVPQISIPLFSIQTAVGNIPFSLDYHIGKVKPSELSGPVGTGWTLTPDLGISRTVHGGIDGVSSGYPNNTQFDNTSAGDAYYYPASVNTIDEQPDDFFYSLLNKSGGFIYDRNAAFATLPYEPLAFEHDDDNGFIITDDDGTRYFFGKYASGSNIETENTGTLIGTLNTLTAWKITEIVSYDNKDTIYFTYGSQKNIQDIPYYNYQWKVIEFPEYSGVEPRVYRTDYSLNDFPGVAGYGVLRPNVAHEGLFDQNSFDFPITPNPVNSDYKITLTDMSPGQATGKQRYMWQQIGYLGGDIKDGSVFSNNYVEELPLTTITYRGGRIELSYSSDYQLTQIRVYASNRLLKTVKLAQHRYTDAVMPPEITSSFYNEYCKRFFLDSVIITGSDSTQPGLRYTMSYTTDGLGIYNNLNNDYWGYWKNNGLFTTPHLPYYLSHYKWYTGDNSDTVSTHIGAAETTPVWLDIGNYQEDTSSSVAPQGAIYRITYPTGGNAVFEFEQNRYESPAEAGRIVYGGGYRIKSIHYLTGQGKDSLIKQYTYGTTTDNGYGLTKFQGYGQNFMYQQWVNPTGYGRSDDTVEQITYINSRPFLDNSFSNGAIVLYPRVTEYSISPANNIPSGKTVYTYIINATQITSAAMTPLQGDSRNDWNAIIPQSVTQYSYHNGSYTPVQKKQFVYTTFSKETVPAAQTFLRWYNMIPNGNNYIYGSFPGVQPFEHIDYSILTGANKLTHEADTLYDQSSSSRYVTVQTDYSYDPAYLYRTGTSTTDSRGYTKVTHYWYPFQSSVPDYSGTQQTYLILLGNNRRLSVPVETIDSVNGNLIQKNRQEFAAFAGGNPLPTDLYTSVLSNAAYKKMQVISYDGYDNIREQQSTDSVRQTYFWGYNSLYPVAKIIGGAYAAASGLVSQPILDNTATSDSAMRIELNKLRTGLPTAQVWTYTYQPGVGMTSKTDPQGSSTFYQYDNLGRLTTILDNDKRILKKINYNTLYNLYYNDQQSQTFARNNCPFYDIAGSVNYTVPADAYFSAVSKAAANNLALQDIQQNGQTYANANCQCSFNSTYLIALNANNYMESAGWHIRLTNLLIDTTFDFAIPQDIQGFLNNIIDTGAYDIRIYNPAGNTRKIFFELGVGNGHPINVTDTAVNVSNVTFTRNSNDPLHIDIFGYVNDSGSVARAEEKFYLMRRQISQASADTTTSVSLLHTSLTTLTNEKYPKCYMASYEYDGFGRLKDAKDKNGNILKKYDYYYSGQ